MARMMRKEQLEAAIAKTTKMLSRSGVPVTQRGAMAYCAWCPNTGKLKFINIPMLPDDPTETFMDAIQGFIDHECAHVFYTDAKEMMAAEKASSFAGQHFHMLANVIEDVRIEALLPKEMPGAEHNLNKVRAHLIETVWRPEFTKLKARVAAGDREARKVLRGNAIIPFLRGLGGQRVCQEFVDDMGLASEFDGLMKAIPDLKERIQDMKSVKDAVSLAELIYKVVTPPEDGAKPKGSTGRRSPPPPPPPPASEQDEQELGDTSGDEGDPGDGSATDGDDDDANVDSSGAGGSDDHEGGDADADAEEGDSDGQEGEDDEVDEDEDELEGEDDEDEDEEDEDDANEQDEGGEDELGDKGKPLPTLKEAMKKLSPAQRRVLFNYNTKRLSIEEISKKLGMSEVSVENTLRQARRRLSHIMNGGK